MSSGRAPRASSRQMRGTQIRSAGNAPAASAVSSARRTLFPATDASPAAQAAPAATAAAQTELAFANSIVRSAVDRLVVEAPVAANVVEWSAGDTADAPAAEVANLPADSSLDQHALLRLVRAVQDEVQALRRELAELRQQLLDRPEPQITDATSPAETPWGRTWSGGR